MSMTPEQKAAAAAEQAATAEQKVPAQSKAPKAAVANAPVNGGATTVAVYCKTPAGLRFLDPRGNKHVINGGHHPSSRNCLGYGVTAMDQEVADHFFKAYSDHPMVKQGLIFRAADEASAKDQAKDMAEVKTGFEPRSQDGKETD